MACAKSLYFQTIEPPDPGKAKIPPVLKHYQLLLRDKAILMVPPPGGKREEGHRLQDLLPPIHQTARKTSGFHTERRKHVELKKQRRRQRMQSLR